MTVEIEQKQDFNIKIYANKRVYLKNFFGGLLAIFLFGIFFITQNNLFLDIVSMIFLIFFIMAIFSTLFQIFRRDPILSINSNGIEDRLSPLSISSWGVIPWKDIKNVRAPNKNTEEIIKKAVGQNTLELSDIAMMIGNISNRNLLFPHSRKSMVSAFEGLNHISIELKDKNEFLRNKNRYIQWRAKLDAKTLGADVLVYYTYMNIDPVELYLYLKGGLEKYGSLKK